MLLIVDDVWETEHAAPFLRARGSACTLLLTTREARVADAIGAPPEAIYNLPVLTEESAMELLGLISAGAVAEDPEGCRRLVRDMECLPLALHIARLPVSTTLLNPATVLPKCSRRLKTVPSCSNQRLPQTGLIWKARQSRQWPPCSNKTPTGLITMFAIVLRILAHLHPSQRLSTYVL